MSQASRFVLESKEKNLPEIRQYVSFESAKTHPVGTQRRFDVYNVHIKRRAGVQITPCNKRATTVVLICSI